MALLKGKLFAGALFAGALLGSSVTVTQDEDLIIAGASGDKYNPYRHVVLERERKQKEAQDRQDALAKVVEVAHQVEQSTEIREKQRLVVEKVPIDYAKPIAKITESMAEVALGAREALELSKLEVAHAKAKKDEDDLFAAMVMAIEGVSVEQMHESAKPINEEELLMMMVMVIEAEESA